jgi:hypothetical protein
MKYKFPLEHVVNYRTKEVCVICDSAITAMGVSAIVKQVLSWIYWENCKSGAP